MYQQYRPSNFSILPPVVKNLLIINGLMFFGTIVLADRGWFDLTKEFALYYPESRFFKPLQFLTHVFMHGSFMHLFFNMFSLWMFGSVMENYWGGKRFFIYYFVTALGAALLHLGVNAYEINSIKTSVNAYLQNPGYDNFYLLQQHDYNLFNNDRLQAFLTEWSYQKNNPEFINGSVEIAKAVVERKMNIPVVGASGAVFGLLMAYGMMFPNTVILIYFLFPLKAKYFVTILGALELWQGFSNNPEDNVAHFAHLGGMLFGFILIKIWNKKNRDYFY
ncbi:MAG: rhomboid family intramembrane serine protease [Bacteroidia bacterium]